MTATFTPTPPVEYGELSFPKVMVHNTNNSLILALSDGTAVVIDNAGLNLPEIINNTQGYVDAIGTTTIEQAYPVIG